MSLISVSLYSSFISKFSKPGTTKQHKSKKEKVNLNPKYISFVSIFLLFIIAKKFRTQKKLLMLMIYFISSGIKLFINCS